MWNINAVIVHLKCKHEIWCEYATWEVYRHKYVNKQCIQHEYVEKMLRDKHIDIRSYLEVFKRNPPLIGWIFGWMRDELWPLEAADGLAAVWVLSGGVNVPAAVKCRFGAVVLQLDGFQREPATGRHCVVALAHRKAARTHTAFFSFAFLLNFFLILLFFSIVWCNIV